MQNKADSEFDIIMQELVMHGLNTFGWPKVIGETSSHPDERWGYVGQTTDELTEFFMSRDWNLSPFSLYPADRKYFKVAVVSIAATGPRIWHERVFNTSILAFDADEFGNMYQIYFYKDDLEDPRRSMHPDRLAALGLRANDLDGKRFDSKTINRVIERVDFVIIFDAERRRTMLETRFPVFKSKRFICSKSDIFWTLWRFVPPGMPPLETYSMAHGELYSVDRPSDEVLLTTWLLSQPNPEILEPSRFYTKLPRLLKEAIQMSQKIVARIFVEDKKPILHNLMLEEGFRKDRVGRIWYKDVPLDDRYAYIQRAQRLFSDDQSIDITWLPVDRTRAFTNDPVILPSEAEQMKMLLDLPVSSLLPSLEDTAKIVPHPRRARLIVAAHEPYLRPSYRRLQDLIASGNLL